MTRCGARGATTDLSYRDGYLYRGHQGGLLGYLPVLGGVLAPGNAWPAQYAWQPAPTINQYYGLNDRTSTAMPTASCTASIRRPRGSVRSRPC